MILDVFVTWWNAILAIRLSWKPLVLYELLASLVFATVIAPIALAATYQLVGLSGESVLGNFELAKFWLSPVGLATLVLTLGLSLGLLFIEYSGLILIADAGLRGNVLSIGQVVAGVVAATPRLLGLAVMQTAIAVAIALPFLALAAGAYWLLLGQADINYFVAEKPPRFWMAVSIGVVLAAGFGLCAAWPFARWAFAVPACVLDGDGKFAALRSSARLMQGRTWRLMLVLGSWLLLKNFAIVVSLVGLDFINAALSPEIKGGLSNLAFSVALLLLLDAFVVQLLAAAFAIILSALVAHEYENARGAQSTDATGESLVRLTPSVPKWPVARTRALIAAVAIAGPLLSLASALALARELVDDRPVKVTAHRAGPKSAPENSLAALRLSIAAGADFVEIDVQQTSDGHVVLLHDRDLRRVTGDPRELTNITLDDIRKLRLRVGTAPTDEQIPTLAEFLDACGDRIRLNIELKEVDRHPNLVKAVLNVVREHNFTDRVVVSSFYLDALAAVKQLEPTIPVGAIVTAAKGDLTQLPVNFLSLNQRLADGRLVRRAHRRSLMVHVWTINDRESAIRMIDLGCDNLITSDPVLIRSVVDEYTSLTDGERALLRLRRWMRE